MSHSTSTHRNGVCCFLVDVLTAAQDSALRKEVPSCSSTQSPQQQHITSAKKAGKFFFEQILPLLLDPLLFHVLLLESSEKLFSVI